MNDETKDTIALIAKVLSHHIKNEDELIAVMEMLKQQSRMALGQKITEGLDYVEIDLNI